LDTVWIDRAAGRAGGATPEAPEAGYDARFESMDEFAAVVGL
jgi:hypothetical protein